MRLSRSDWIELWCSIERLRPLAVEILSDLVAAPSLGGNELECQRRVAAWMQRLGGQVSEFEVDADLLRRLPGYIPAHSSYKERPNVVGRWRGHSARPSLIINSHVDVVDPGDLSEWDDDPWQPRVREGRLFGRGATDAKGCLAAALLALAALRELQLPFQGDLMLQSVVDEEATGNGTLDCLRRGMMADGVIVMEPTSLEVCSGHRGLRGLHVRVQGEAAHTGGAGGRSAIRLAGIVINELEGLNAVWRKISKENDFDPPRINIGKIAGGDSIYVVPDRCEFWAGIRYAPGQMAELLNTIKETVRVTCQREDTPSAVTFEEFYDVEAMPSNADSETVRLLAQCAAQVTGKTLSIKTFQAGCDARHFARFGIPTAIFGPGALAVAHASNEFVEISEIISAAKILTTFILSRRCQNELRDALE
jgi:acetylornithine deacetylase